MRLFDRLIDFQPAVAEAPVQQGEAAGGGQPTVPFIVGSNLYAEAPFFTETQALDATSHEYVENITPGNFLRGVVLKVSSAGGVIGTGVLAADAPWSVLGSISLEDISGGSILYPMTGFAAYTKQKWFQPWSGDPAKRPDYSKTVNPAFTLRVMVELRDTLAILSNTDARAQYRLRFTVAPSTAVFSTAPTTLPTLTIEGWVEEQSQPDAQDLLGNPIAALPLGLSTSRFVMHEVPSLNAGANVIRHMLMGNEIRAVAWIVRNSAGARIDLTDASAGPLDLRLDNRRLFKRNPSAIVEQMCEFYEELANGTWTRDTGVYVYPRFRDPGRLLGDYWLQTVEQTLLQLEFTGGDLGANAPGSLEIVYDELAVAGQLPGELEGI